MRKTLAILGLLSLAICAAGDRKQNRPAGTHDTDGTAGAASRPSHLSLQPEAWSCNPGTRPPSATDRRLVTTPTANLSIVSNSPVGATNAASNLQVGATNSTVERATAPVSAVQTAVEINQSGAVALAEWASPQVMPQPVSRARRRI